MAKTLKEIFPPPEELLALEPEDIAALLLDYFNQNPGAQLHRYNFTLQGAELGQYAGRYYKEVVRVVTAACTSRGRLHPPDLFLRKSLCQS